MTGILKLNRKIEILLIENEILYFSSLGFFGL